MSSYPPGAGRHTATAAAAGAATYGIDLEIELLKPQSASIRTYSSASSSPNSTLSESSTSLSPALSICTRKPRTARKRPNQTYNEAAALLSTAYPNVFSPKHLSKPPSFKFAKPTDSPAWLNGDEHDLLLPDKPFEPRLGLLTCTTFSDDADDKPYPSPMDDNENHNEDDFDTKSILDEEVGGIDSIMGNLTVRGDINQHHQQTDTFCYGLPMGLGLGLGLLGGRFDFGFGLTRGVSAFRNSPIAGYGGAGEWWGYPAMTTVDVQAISPTLDKKPALDKKAKSTKKKKKAPAPDENMNAKDDKQTEASVAPVAPPPTVSESRIQLKLDYDDVLSAWSDRGSPFSDDSPASELRGRDVEARLAQIDLFGDNEEREARVQRYKDKRRNRLFSKKIRYQVRKVNADQRPRMKGRFVRSPESSSGGAQT